MIERHMDRTTPIAKLSPRQIDCLRLVLVRMNSKEIAQELGLSSHTVNDHLRAATKTLEASSRFEAARILAEHEAPPQRLRGQPLRIPEGTDSVTYEVAPDLGVTLEAPQHGLSVQESRAVFDIVPAVPAPKSKLRLLTWGIERNDLTAFQRMAYVLLLLAGIAFATGIAVVGMVGLTALLRAILNGTTANIVL